MKWDKSEIVIEVVLPFIFPGLIVQEPAGKSFNTTEPVAIVHVGPVTVPNAGAAGLSGCASIITESEAAEVQPSVFVTVKL